MLLLTPELPACPANMPVITREAQVGSGWVRLLHSLSDVVLNYLFELQPGRSGAGKQVGRTWACVGDPSQKPV